LGLFAEDGTLIDAVSFSIQTNNVSQGRFRDGGPSIYFMTNPTPRAANLLARSNTPPVLAQILNRTINEGTLLSFSAVASDADFGQALSFSLDLGAPEGASIHPTNGTFVWMPSEAQGPGIHSITVRVTDSGTPPLADSKTFSVTVAEVNNPPVLEPITNRTVDENGLLSLTAVAGDPDNDPQTLTFSLDESPPGMSINPTNGLITWTPTENDGPGSYSATVRVRDNGEPPLSATTILSIFVNEVNTAPNLDPIADAIIHAGSRLRFATHASDVDLPAQTLTYELASGAPEGATVDELTGVFDWTPPANAAPSTNSIALLATDSGSPPLAAIQTFKVIVASSLKVTAERLPEGGTRLVWSAISGHTYRVQFNDELNENGWTDLGEPITATGTSASADDPNAVGHRFYRIQTSP
jgi:hypothetical protein